MLSMGWMLAESGLYPPVVGMWAPNVVCAAIGAILLTRAVSEKPVVLPPLPAWLKRGRWFHPAFRIKGHQ